MSKKLDQNDVTPESVYMNRRFFLKTSIFAASGLATASIYRAFRKNLSSEDVDSANLNKYKTEDTVTSYSSITGYNNFYEFSTDKEKVAQASENWKIKDWALEISGLVEKPLQFNLKDINDWATEERIYRFRCVEGWSMVIPWTGLQLSTLLEKVKPLSTAKYVAFESYYSEQDMPDAGLSGITLPYVEGLRLDEALNPLTLIATGLYRKKLPPQNGAPLRLVVPWKYGFKSIKSVVKIKLTDQEPPTTWNIANPQEYGFYSNVNPNVNHPRWSQAMERVIGETRLKPTLLFNGYEKEVSSLYSDMDLRKYF